MMYDTVYGGYSMGAFEPRYTQHINFEEHCIPQPKKVKDESIVTYKVYDSCRRQDCLTPRELGPSLAAAENRGDVVWAPEGAESVSMRDLKISKIHIVSKKPCSFRNGFWDINIKYTFDYKLTFQDAGGCTLDTVDAYNTFSSKVTLFGSTGNDLTIGTDLSGRKSDSVTFEATPFAWVEAKAVGLAAKLHRHHGKGYEHCQEVHCIIGLFSTLKLFRTVHLNVQSTGFCIPEACGDICDIHPCEYFADLDFPIDIFTPPQRKEFNAGQHGNIGSILQN